MGPPPNCDILLYSSAAVNKHFQLLPVVLFSTLALASRMTAWRSPLSVSISCAAHTRADMRMCVARKKPSRRDGSDHYRYAYTHELGAPSAMPIEVSTQMAICTQ